MTTLSSPNRPGKHWDDGSHHTENATPIGFWLYLMSDCLIFAVLFAAYAVLGHSYAGGPSGAQIFARAAAPSFRASSRWWARTDCTCSSAACGS